MGKTQQASGNKQGFVYILSNPAHRKGLIKIGHTTKTPEERAKQLYDTSSPEPFDVLYKMEFENSKKAEQQIHFWLQDYRYNRKREYFTCSIRKAIDTINSADGRVGVLKGDSYELEIFLFISTFVLTLWFVL